ncbi:DUF3617 family protein [Solimicrobium silvestre]|uniref:DUF3617 domain-containing protein n=1 Tax=Solimicrobium silvestre TaxID=2099400 RepID=A0A2S9H3V3_9BURK|nr:DUF3617 family protein [Solimicrobium silvestre]PRC94662.1 hypothetical protein S2091_0665 [Solimicrobium silvestre]
MKKTTLAILLILSGIASAQTSSLKAGLWDMKQIKQVLDGQDMSAKMAAVQEKMQESMAKMTPEQRKKMEGMMNMGAGGTIRVCISPAMAARNAPIVDREGHCAPAKVTRSGNTSTFEFNCTNNGRTSVGSGKSTVNGDTVSTSVDMTVTDAKGHHSIQSESQMTFLGADCQGIKPADQMMKEMHGTTQQK